MIVPVSSESTVPTLQGGCSVRGHGDPRRCYRRGSPDGVSYKLWKNYLTKYLSCERDRKNWDGYVEGSSGDETPGGLKNPRVKFATPPTRAV